MKLNEKTTVPLWSVITAVPVVAGFVVWLSFIAAGTNSNAADIQKLEGKSELQVQILNKIKEDVSYIRGKLDRSK